MQANNEIVTGPAQSRAFLVVGLLLGGGSLAAYVIQFSEGVLVVPWYLPIFTTTGCLMFVWALLQHRTWSRTAGLVFMTLLSLAAWAFIGYARLPEYVGPVKSAYAFPPFASLTADGQAFTQADLKAPQNTVIVFFRGRW